MKAILGLVNGLVTTRNMLRAKSLVAMGRAKRGGLQSRVRRKQLKLTLAALGCVILFGLVSLSVFWLISRQTMQVQVPHGYLVVSDGILDMPSGKLIYRFPQAIRPYVLAHPDADDNWNIYEFEKNSVVVYHLNKSTHAMSEVHRVDISKIYQSTRQFYSSEIDASGLVLAMPSSDAKSYYFISLNKEAEVKARNFERVFPCESRDCFWVLAGNSIRRYDFRNDSTENWGILPSQPSAFFSSVSPNGRYFLSVKHDRQGFIGLRRSEYKIEVYDFASNCSSSFRVSGWGFIEKVMFLDSKHALLVFGFPLMGYWEIKVIDVTQERYSTWKTFRSPISVYRYIPAIQVLLKATDLLGRVEQSVERPSGDTTKYAYTPAGRLESEVRAGQVWYSRYYGYNLDGSRAMVMRDDALNGTHWDVYAYDPVSGRLASVQDALTGEVHRFAWNPEGTLQEWSRSFPCDPFEGCRWRYTYDEEWRLLQIEQEQWYPNHGNGWWIVQRHQYNSDGVLAWSEKAGIQHRYLCGIGCGRIANRVYILSGEGWELHEERLVAPTVIWYGAPEKDSGFWLNAIHSFVNGFMLSAVVAPYEWKVYPTDFFGVEVYSPIHVAKVKREPEFCIAPGAGYPPSVFVPWPSPPRFPVHPLTASSKLPSCGADGRVIGVPKTDPAYKCYANVCARWRDEIETIDDFANFFCQNIPNCAMSNWMLPPADPKINKAYYDECYQSGGAEGIYGYTAILGCCIECQIRVCFWISKPRKAYWDLWRDKELRECQKKFHGRN